MKRFIKRVVLTVVLLGIVGAGAAWYLRHDGDNLVSYRTGEVTRGDLLITIDATGTVEPEEVIDVGAQIAGQIVSFGKDVDGKTVDYGSSVEEGTILARIDDTLYAAAEAEARAQVQYAEASIRSARADLEQMKAKLHQAERDWNRAQKLGPSEALAQASYDAYQSAYETAKANVEVAEAAILQRNASLAEAEAVLRRAKRNLEYCTIKSPVKGVIIDRRVNIGQTVVASLNAPSLFLIAKDLTRMQVWVAVNEADIGKIHPGQPVMFTVDAFPEDTFRGEVGKVRLNASMTQNVVTYTIEIITDNSSGRLLPYLTANVHFELHRLNNVMLVPNAALRWTPSVTQIAPELRQDFENRQAAGKQAPATQGSALAQSVSEKPKNRTLWLMDGEYVQPLQVKAGLSDGSMTEVQGKGLSEGMKVVTGVSTATGGEKTAQNPFAPKFPRLGRSEKSR